MSCRQRCAGIAVGAAVARYGYLVLRRHPPAERARWVRSNYRGRQVSLAAGAACALGCGLGVAATSGVPGRARCAGTVAALGAGMLGGYDDLVGSGGSRGLAGHLGTLARGEVTGGSVKLFGLAATGVGAAAVLPPRTAAGGGGDVLAAGAAVAGSANLVNLFDLRPGRALKVGLLAGAPLLLAGDRAGSPVAAPLGSAVALLPEDLGERAMLGDAGANALGAALGLAAVSVLGRRGRLALLAGTCGLTAASEVVSFSSIIDALGPLRWFDRLGRRPPGE